MTDREADLRTVGHFVRRLRRVAQHPLAANNADDLVVLGSVQITIGRTKDGKMVMRSPLPDEVAFESLATRLRPFLVPTDDLHFEKAFQALDRLVTPEREQYLALRQQVCQQWRDAVERSDRTRAYKVITQEAEFSDVVLAYSWLYGDSIHGDHAKVETLDIIDRFRAAVGFFSGVAVIAVATLNMIRQLVELGVVELPEQPFTDDVVVTQSEIRVELVDAYQADVGVDTSDLVNSLLQQEAGSVPPTSGSDGDTAGE